MSGGDAQIQCGLSQILGRFVLGLAGKIGVGYPGVKARKLGVGAVGIPGRGLYWDSPEKQNK
jgi:hypothetical protein